MVKFSTQLQQQSIVSKPHFLKRKVETRLQEVPLTPEEEAQQKKEQEEYNKQLAEYNKQQKELDDWETARKLLKKGQMPFGLSGDIRKKYKILAQARIPSKSKTRAFQQLEQYRIELGAKEIKPIVSITGTWTGAKVTTNEGTNYNLTFGETTTVPSELNANIYYGQKPPLDIRSVVKPYTPFTKEQQEQSAYLTTPSIINKLGDFVSNTWKKIVGVEKPKELAFEMKSVSAQNLPSGTKSEVPVFTPESQLKVSEDIEYLTKSEQNVNVNYENYVNRLSKLTPEEQTQSTIDRIKETQLAIYRRNQEQLDEVYQKNMITGMKKISQEKGLKTFALWGAEKVGKAYYNVINWEDKRLAKDLFGTAEQFEKENFETFSKIKKMGYSSRETKELVEARSLIAGSIQGIYKGIYEHPVTIGGRTLAYAGVIATAGVIASHSVGVSTLATSKAVKWAGIGLIGLYAGSVAIRTLAPETTFEKGVELGKIGSTEVLPMIVGGYIGLKTMGKVNKIIDKIGYKWSGKYKYRSPYKITKMSLLKEEQKFPTINPYNKDAQLEAFINQRQNVLADELQSIRSGTKIKAGFHATANRVAFKGKETMLLSEGREISGMSVSSSDLSIRFLRLNQEPSYSLLSSQGLPVGNAPLGLRIELQGYGKIPSSYKPLLTKLELQEILGAKIKPEFFKETAFLYEKGYFGKGYVTGIKPEVEAYLRGGGILEKTTKPIVYTSIADKEFYAKLEPIERLGNTEYVWHVEKFALTKPSTWIDKLMGRKAGQFKSINVGTVVPIGRYEALPFEAKESQIATKIQKMIEMKVPRTKIINTLAIEQKILSSSGLSSSALSSKSLSYPFEYSFLLSSPSKKPSYSPPSYKTSRNYSLKSAISSVIPSLPPSSHPSRISSSSIFSYSVPSKPSYSPPYIPPYEPPYYPPKKSPELKGLKRQLRYKKLKLPNILGVLPDFTAIVLGLKPQEFKATNMKKIMKKLNKIETGFGIRTGARIKGITNKQEKILMKGAIPIW